MRNAFLRGYKPWNDPNDGPETNMSVSFLNYYAWDKNHTIIQRLELNPYDYKFYTNEIWRQRRKHHSSYNHHWDALGGYNIQWR